MSDISDLPPLRLLARGSPLSRLQCTEALPTLQQAFPGRTFTQTFRSSLGDTDLKTPLTDPAVPGDFFTRELDEALLAGEADLVVHSAKDLPVPLREGLVPAAFFPARDTRDALCVRPGTDLARGGVVGTSSPVREAEIRKQYPAITCKSIRGTIGQRLAQMDAGEVDAVIIAACALQRLGWDGRIHSFLDYETTPLQGRLAVTVRADRQDLIDALRSVDVRRHAGLVALVGCPAESRLLGQHARDLLEAADVVLHDRLVPGDLLEALGAKAEYVGKQGHAHSTTQAHIHRRILHEAEAGKLVVRLHGGDPGVLGHLGETLDFCRAWHLRTEVVAAISAAQLAAARAACSLTHRHHGRSITFLSGHKALADHEPAALTPEHGNLAVYMGVRDAAAIQQRLLEAGWATDTPVTAAMDMGQPEEELLATPLHSLGEAPLRAPAVLLIGPQPHFPPYTLFTGTDPRPFLHHGPLLHHPMIRLEPRPVTERAAALLEGLPRWQGLIFASTAAVRLTVEALCLQGDVRLLAGKTLLAVGPLTAAALAEAGLRADAAPKGFGGAAALAELPDLPPGRYGYLSSNLTPLTDRQAALADRNLQLEALILYDNHPHRPGPLPRRDFHRVLFTAASTVAAYFDHYPEERTAPREWLAVGSSTLAALQARGLKAWRI